MSQEKTLVVILCMHRCGSSLTAQLLHSLGMSLGPYELGEANESNPYGHFEAQPFVLLNREIQLREFGFEGDLPDDDEVFRRYCKADGRWSSQSVISEEAIARGRDLIGQLMQSGDVCGFKDPRTVQTWPFWRQVFASLPKLRIVPLFVVRGPHEIAMSVCRRSRGDRDYAQALDVAAIHFRRMKDILDQWRGPSAVVQFDPRSFGSQARRAAELCGLTWSDSVLAEVYDLSCRHHEAAAIDHPAQAAFEAFCGLPSSRSDGESPRQLENVRQLLADAAARETMLRKGYEVRRQERDTAWRERDAARQECDVARYERDLARHEITSLQLENNSLRQTAARVPPLEVELAQATCDLNLIRNSRTWRLREALAGALGRGTKTFDGQSIVEPWPDGQDAQSPAAGRHYCERKDHAGD